ncbi:hypothetical protein NY08_1867 [Rhodococcus sp. B7740]|nr:hypothetical protein NY08_1867 [Rhodococcus sp. B7740]
MCNGVGQRSISRPSDGCDGSCGPAGLRCVSLSSCGLGGRPPRWCSGGVAVGADR